jgi:hypothetical protein
MLKKYNSNYIGEKIINKLKEELINFQKENHKIKVKLFSKKVRQQSKIALNYFLNPKP